MTLLQPHVAIGRRLERSGPSFEDFASRLKSLMQQDDDLKVAMSAVTEYAKLAVGYAPTTSKSLQLHGKVDKFFETEVFENPPPPKIDEEK